jgi:hypothetical protein
MKLSLYIVSLSIFLGLPLQLASQDTSKSPQVGSSQNIYSWLSSGLSSGANKAKSGLSYLNPQPLLPWAQKQWQSLTGEVQEWWNMPTAKAKSLINKSISYGQDLYEKATSLSFGLPKHLKSLQAYVSTSWDTMATWQKAQIITLLIALAGAASLAYGGGSFEVVSKLVKESGLGKVIEAGSTSLIPDAHDPTVMVWHTTYAPVGLKLKTGLISHISKEQIQNLVAAVIGIVAALPSLSKLASNLFQKAKGLVNTKAPADELEDTQKEAEIASALAKLQVEAADNAVREIKNIVPTGQ